LQVRARNGQRNAGQPGPRADVDNRGTLRDCLLDDGAVNNVPFPQAWHLAGAYKTTSGPVCSERIMVSLREGQAGAEY
ncbi:hypothetical protein EY06_15370, partial [Staphylococcus aureus]